MDLIVEHVDVWAAGLQDKPGELAGVLSGLRAAETPGKGVVFVTPLQGDMEIAAAAQLGFNVTQTLHSVRIMGPNQPGIGAQLTRKLADAGINLRGFSASVIGPQFIAYAAVDSRADAEKAMGILKSL